MKKAIGAFLAACLMLGSLALPAAAAESQMPAPPGPKLRSERSAMNTSVTSTLVSWGLVLGGWVLHVPGLMGVGFFTTPLGPSLGYFGAGLQGRAWGGLGLRALGLAGVMGGAGTVNESDNYGLFMIGGAALLIGSTIYDLATIKRAVRKRNSRIQGMSLNVAPALSPRSKTVGLTIQLGF